MCLLITAFAAVGTAVLWYLSSGREALHLELLPLMYSGAALMWLADGFFAVAEGEPFLDLSANDALLGLVILLCGAIIWLVQLLVRDPRHKFRSLIRG